MKNYLKVLLIKELVFCLGGLKQDLQLEAKISEKNEIIVDGQLVGKIHGLKISLNYSNATLQTDIRSIKKAARNGAANELQRRIRIITNSSEQFCLKKDKNIYWQDQIIGKIYPGKNYLNPDIKVIVD